MAGKQLTEFEIARKKRQSKIAVQRIKKLLIVVLVSAVLVTGIYFIVSEDLLGIIADRINISQSPSASMPVGLAGTSVRSVSELNGNISLITDSTMYLYSQSGGVLLSEPHGMVNPVARCSGRKILLFDHGGSSLIVRTRDKVLLDTAFDSKIINADINADGDLAVVTEAQRYASQLHIFGSDLETEALTWSASSDYIIAASVSPDGKKAAAVSLAGNEYGEMVSVVHMLDIASGRVTAQKEFKDSSAISLCYDSQGNIKLLCDSFAAVLDEDLNILSSFYFTDTLSFYSNRSGADGMALLFDRFTEARATRVVLLQSDFGQQKDISLSGKYELAAAGENSVLVFMNSAVEVIGYDGTRRDSIEFSDDPLILAEVGNNIYAVTRQELCAVSVSEDITEEEK